MFYLEDLLTLLAYAGTVVFAISGALMGLRKGMDIIGVAFVANVTGLGGGTLRDVILGATPVSWATDPTNLVICFGVAALLCVFNKALIGRRMTWLLYADAVGLVIFAVLGAYIALQLEAHPVAAILFGAMSATFGGVIRDIICSEPPVLFRKEIYISAALLAACGFVLFFPWVGFDGAALLGIVAGLSLRLLAIWKDWSLPFPRYDTDE